MSNPKNLEHADGWYLNVNKSPDGSPAELYNGWGTMAAGDCVFYTAGERAKSGDAFVVALTSGFLKGPFQSKAEAAAGVSAAKVEVKKTEPVSAPAPKMAPKVDEMLEADEDEDEDKSEEDKPAPKVEVKKSSPAKK